MISISEFEKTLKKHIFNKCYIFCGPDEQLIREYVNAIIKIVVSPDLADLNLSKIDGTLVDDFDKIINECETFPLMSEKRVVLIYRADFLNDSSGGNNIVNAIKKYILNMPSYSILIIYYVYSDKQKMSDKVKRIGSKATVIEVPKLKGNLLEKKIKHLFDEREKEIGKVELYLFSSLVENDFNTIINEVDKLCSYTEGRSIKKDDIYEILPYKNDNTFFNLIDFLSAGKTNKAIETLSELTYKGQKDTYIISMLERQYKLMLNIKCCIQNREGKEDIIHRYSLNPYYCERLMQQSKKFEHEGLLKALKICMDTEKNLKSKSFDSKLQMEMLIYKLSCI